MGLAEAWACLGGREATHDQVADEDLEDLGLQALATLEDLLQDADEEVAQGRADEGAVDGHLGHARGEVVAALAAVVGNPRGQELLQAGEGARGEDLGAQRVGLELLEVGLWGIQTVNISTPELRMWGNSNCARALTAR